MRTDRKILLKPIASLLATSALTFSVVILATPASAGATCTMSAGAVAATANGLNAFACGSNALASGDNATAIGTDSDANGLNATATGQASLARGDNATATGQNAFAYGNNATATGRSASAEGVNATATGEGSRAAGTRTTATGQGAIAQGESASSYGQGATAIGNYAMAIGRSSAATSFATTAIGTGSSATAVNATALGRNAAAGHANSIAIGAGVTTDNPNQVKIGSISNTYTMSGIASPESRAAQAGPTYFTTSDASGNLAISDYGPSSIAALDGRIDRAYEGAAMAMAMAAPAMPYDKNYAVSINWGNFEGSNAFAGTAQARISENFMIHGGIGAGTRGTMGGRAGMTFAW